MTQLRRESYTASEFARRMRLAPPAIPVAVPVAAAVAIGAVIAPIVVSAIIIIVGAIPVLEVATHN
jgi:hypothetical protein